MRDASHFPEPDQFNPSRFLDDKGCVNNDIPHDPSKLVFGFGRRFVSISRLLNEKKNIDARFIVEVVLGDFLPMI